MKTHIVWLRTDLRVHDNPALYAACSKPDARVLALYIATPGQWRAHDMSPRQADFLFRNLIALQQALAERGIPLHYHQCDDFAAAAAWLADFCLWQRADALFYNYQYEFNERRRDRAVERTLDGRVVCQGFDDGVLLPPGSVITGDQRMYKVFTPFRSAFIRRLRDDCPQCLPAPPRAVNVPAPDLAALEPFDYRARETRTTIPPAKRPRYRACAPFAINSCRITAGDGTSRHWMPPAGYPLILLLEYCRRDNVITGCVRACPTVLAQAGSGAFCWLNELIWRDFLPPYHGFLSRRMPTPSVYRLDPPCGLAAGRQPAERLATGPHRFSPSSMPPCGN